MENISIELLLFAGASEVAGVRSMTLAMAPGATVGELRESLISRYPQLGTLAAVSRWAVGEEFVDDRYRLEDSVRVAMIPPVSGG